MSPISAPVQISFQSVQWEASPQIGEMLRFCDFFVGYTGFSRARTQIESSHAWMDFHGLWLIPRVFAKGRPFWGCNNIRIHLGVISP